jgi:hypothetical protein
MAHTPTTSPERMSGFRVTIRIIHPVVLPESISKQVGITPDLARAV